MIIISEKQDHKMFDNEIACYLIKDKNTKGLLFFTIGKIRETRKLKKQVKDLTHDLELATELSDNITTENEIIFNHADSIAFLKFEEKSLRKYTCNIIRLYLKKYNNNVLAVAEKLDIGKITIYTMIQEKEIIIR